MLSYSKSVYLIKGVFWLCYIILIFVLIYNGINCYDSNGDCMTQICFQNMQP